MRNNNLRSILQAAGLFGVVLWLILGTWHTAALAHLPPRPTDSPDPSLPLPPGEPRPVGGWTELRVPQVADPDLWTVVQWQDSTGAWVDVSGWRGTLDGAVDGTARKKWFYNQWVYGQGPFRWVAYRKSTGQILGTSSTFSLAPVDQKTTVVELTLLP